MVRSSAGSHHVFFLMLQTFNCRNKKKQINLLRGSLLNNIFQCHNMIFEMYFNCFETLCIYAVSNLHSFGSVELAGCWSWTT